MPASATVHGGMASGWRGLRDSKTGETGLVVPCDGMRGSPEGGVGTGGQTSAERGTYRRTRVSLLVCFQLRFSLSVDPPACQLGRVLPLTSGISRGRGLIRSGFILRSPTATPSFFGRAHLLHTRKVSPAPSSIAADPPGEPRRCRSRRFRRRCAVSPCAASASRARPWNATTSISRTVSAPRP